MKFLTIGERRSDSLWSLVRRRGAGSVDGDARNMVMGTWSKTFEGREVSELLMEGRRRGFTN